MAEGASADPGPLDATRLLGVYRHCAHFSAVGCDRWRSGCGVCPQLRAYPKTYGPDRTQAYYRYKTRVLHRRRRLTLIVPSEWLARTVKQSF